MIRAALSILALMTGPALAQMPKDVVLSPLVTGFDFGLYCHTPPDRIEEAPGTAAGVVNMLDVLPEFRARQAQVPAALGIAFGVHVSVADGAVYDPSLVTITHPPYPDTGIEVEQWLTSIDGGAPNLVGFSFEVPSELVLGAWTISAAYDDEQLFEITFDVVASDQFPEIAQMCQGAFLS